MSDTTLETPHALPPEGRSSSPPPADGGPRSLLDRSTWWLVALLVVAAAGAIIAITGTRPGYDPYGWLDWGYQTLRGTLDLGGAPSWKPFTYLFNVPYAIFGHYALWLWMLTAISISLSGGVFGGRIAYRLVAAERTPQEAAAGGLARFAPAAAAVFAGAAVFGIDAYFHYLLSAQSDSMLVAVCLAAIDCHLNGRHRWAWWLLALASLGRPEVWPFAGLYAIWVFIKFPKQRWQLYAGVAGIAFLWFGVPTITNHRPNIAGQLALLSPRECTSNKIVCTADRYRQLDYAPVELAALLAFVLALWRRNWTVVALAGAVALWVLTEIAFALHGFPGVPRYLFEPAALTAVLGGVMFGWLLLPSSRFDRRIPSWLGIPLAVVLVGTMVPDAISQIRTEHKDIYHERLRAKEINRLSAYITALGGPKHVLQCGRPVTNVEYVSIMAWYVHQNTGKIGHRPKFELHQKYPIIMFSPFPNGWGATPYRTPANLRSTCANIKSIYVPTARHPQGVMIPK